MTRQNEESRGKIALYQDPNGTVELDVRLERETIWLSQKQMALLFDKDADTIGLHIRNAYKEGELEESATTEDSSVVQNEGGRTVRRPVRFYNLDVVISVGYRVKSKRGTQFRIWATKLRLIKTVEGDPEFDTKRAQKKLRRYVESQDHAIRLKAEIMVDHFCGQVFALTYDRSQAGISGA